MENNTRMGCFRPVTDHPDVNVECSLVVSVCEGKELYETCCPVSKYTGHRESPFKLLGKLTGAKADVLNSLLQELPTVFSDPRLTDSDRARFIVERAVSGTPAEQAIVAERLANDLEALGFSQKQAQSVAESSKIEFDKTEVPVEPES